MTVLHTGIDMIEVDRLKKAIDRHGEKFLQRIFTESELEQLRDDVPSLTARWAAKEAVAKALHTGIGNVSWQEIEILRGPAREPVLTLYGAAEKISKKEGITQWSVSISHTIDYAVAMVVAT
jgi:holo-[acyl-carrier protein] synthase